MKHRSRMIAVAAVVSALAGHGLAVMALGFPTAQAAEPVSIESLLDEMTDRDSVARFPETHFRLRQASSYDRLSKTPGDPDGWFANKDHTKNFVRVEENNGRQEWVIMDHHAPGTIVRSWMPDKRIPSGGKTPVDTKIRIYLDGNDEPALEGHMLDLFNGTSLIPPPLAHKSLASAVSFFPIPYAKSCKVTLDQPPFFYILTYREYAADTPIRSYTQEGFQAARPAMQRVGKALLNPMSATKGEQVLIDTRIAPKAEASVDLPAGEAAIRTLSVHLAADIDPQVTRSLVLKMEFDGKPTVWCPVGDFFGTGAGIHPFQGWWRTVGRDGTMTCRWVMPYRGSGKVTLLNLHNQPVPVRLEAVVGEFSWDERSLYFHANWRHQYPVATRPFSDFNYVTLTGRGVYVGDTLTVMNPIPTWWGEGDAKIWVDGEKFPSIFGTGTEDYYAYSWGGKHTDFYEHPFHAQPRAHRYNQLNPKTDPAQRSTQGYSTETRTRALDTMPFGKSLQVDMEVWHWKECDMAYAVATYWYGDADTKTTGTAETDEAARPIVPPPAASPAQPKPAVRRFQNAIECETMKIVAKSGDIPAAPQPLHRFGGQRWSGANHLFVRAGKIGDFVELRFAVEGDGPCKLILHATKSHDYGVLRLTVNGLPTGEDVDTYAEKPGPLDPLELGVFKPIDGAFTLRAEVVGKSAKSEKTGTYFGLDCVVVRKETGSTAPHGGE